MSTEKKTFTLLELASSIQRAIQNLYNRTYWVRAEMHKLNKTPKGHCYPELVHKENGVIVAEMRGTIWKNNFDDIRLRFEEVVKEPFRDGLTLLFQVKVNFHPLYGMGLEIVDIDPHYTLGELQKEREETLKKLKANGILNKNHYLPFPLVPKNIAIISVESSKGLSDFMTVLQTNPYGYRFNTKLFPAILNGDGAVETIQKQLQNIRKYTKFFDVLVIVRGGGGEIGMTCYNNYQLCEAIANFPIPVLTGIGHSTNLTVAEMIAYKSAITPTELAGFFVESFRKFELNFRDAQRKITDEAMYLLSQVRKDLMNESRVFRNTSFNSLIHAKQNWKQAKRDLIRVNKDLQKTKSNQLLAEAKTLKQHLSLFQKMKMNDLKSNQTELIAKTSKYLYTKETAIQDTQMFLHNHTPRLIEQAGKSLTQLETIVKLVDPDNVLKKGYSISLVNGKVISESNLPQKGDELTTLTAFAELKTSVREVKLHSDR